MNSNTVAAARGGRGGGGGYKLLRSLFTIAACASTRQAWCKMIYESAKTTTRQRCNKCCDKSSPTHAAEKSSIMDSSSKLYTEFMQQDD